MICLFLFLLMIKFFNSRLKLFEKKIYFLARKHFKFDLLVRIKLVVLSLSTHIIDSLEIPCANVLVPRYGNDSESCFVFSTLFSVSFQRTLLASTFHLHRISLHFVYTNFHQSANFMHETVQRNFSLFS